MRKVMENLAIVIVLIFMITSIVGFILDRPVLVSYASSESMTPTINVGDLFFINPLSRRAEVGDIIVFQRRDGWTVHRVYAITSDGYITKGDNNVATDQQEGLYPTVKKSDMAGKVIVLFGRPLVVRKGGELIENIRSKATNLYVVGILVVMGAVLTFSGSNRKERHRKKSSRRFVKLSLKTVYAVISVAIIAGFVFVTISSWGTIAFTYSSTLAGGQREGWYLPGTSFERNITIENHAVYPFYYFIEPRRERVTLLGDDTFRVTGGMSHEVLLKISVPQDTRVYREEVEVRSYPAILPFGAVEKAYSASPYIPLILYSSELVAIMMTFYILAGIGKDELLRIKIRRRSVLGKIFGDGKQ
ncbi:signal peptidase I [Thermococcus sp. MAR1]|uniref:signal peptidase I n=1 Tax=Thermococcus sp. MAR1 TaxID=1638263 RepID=UPI001438A52D|nr:signal peptidase I [Thermococcus sp. MAR1]NJE11214.1 signal peptidase I [Thermococcus sp. MAR1]